LYSPTSVTVESDTVLVAKHYVYNSQIVCQVGMFSG
jgi:hypothetical protein